MLTSVIGGIVLAAPLLGALLFKDRFRGTLLMAVGMIAFHAVAALIAQSLHVFTYGVMMSFSTALALAVTAVAVWKWSKCAVDWRSFEWPALVMIILIGAQLYAVRSNYTGIAQTVTGENYVVRDRYPYPLFSDEWVTAAMADRSIAGASLPLENPLKEGERFPNLLAPFHALLAEMFLVLKVSPVSGFATMAILFGTGLASLFYVFLRSLHIRRLAALFGLLVLPAITNGANLPGLWFVMPFLASLPGLFAVIAGAVAGDRKLALAGAAVAVFIYPPMAIFVVSALVPMMVSRAFRWRDAWLVLVPGAVAGVAALSQGSDLWQLIKLGFYHENLDHGIISYGIWNVLPWGTLLAACGGAYIAWKKRLYPLLAAVGTGLAMWIFYAFYEDVIIIEYPRVVVITSVLAVVLMAVGIHGAGEMLERRHQFFTERRAYSIGAAVLLLVCFMTVFSYPNNEKWRRLTLALRNGPMTYVVQPAAPINRYLTPDDLDLFRGISGAKFIAPAWKGLVIGVATRSYPMESKSSTVGTRLVMYRDFMDADCAAKADTANRFNIEYVYSQPFECVGFEPLGKSSEGLVLYRFNAAP